MKTRIASLPFGVAMLCATAMAQTSPLKLPSSLDKQLAERASNVTEVTLGKNMLTFAAKFMNGNDKDDAAMRQLIEGLDGIYVRDYEFDKPGQYSPDEVESLRNSFETPQWTSIVRERDRKNGESTDVMMKMVNGESQGMFVLSAEPKELAIVMILGPIRADELGELKGLGGLGKLSVLPQLKQRGVQPDTGAKPGIGKDGTQ